MSIGALRGQRSGALRGRRDSLRLCDVGPYRRPPRERALACLELLWSFAALNNSCAHRSETIASFKAENSRAVIVERNNQPGAPASGQQAADRTRLILPQPIATLGTGTPNTEKQMLARLGPDTVFMMGDNPTLPRSLKQLWERALA